MNNILQNTTVDQIIFETRRRKFHEDLGSRKKVNHFFRRENMIPHRGPLRARSQIKDLIASLSACSAKVVDFVVNLPQLRASLSAHPANFKKRKRVQFFFSVNSS